MLQFCFHFPRHNELTSVLAIVALLGGRFYGWAWLDSTIGILGAVIIARWSYGLLPVPKTPS